MKNHCILKTLILLELTKWTLRHEIKNFVRYLLLSYPRDINVFFSMNTKRYSTQEFDKYIEREILRENIS